jgi:Xaa-Pro aminopeptidase
MDTAFIFYSATHIARRTAAGTVTRHGGFPMPTSACTRHRKSHNGHRAGNKLSGWEVDKAARDVLQVAGYAEYLSNRVGHSIGTEVHGTGAISTTSSLATSAHHSLIPVFDRAWDCLPEFGLRSEVNMLVRRDSAEVTGRIQREMVLI